MEQAQLLQGMLLLAQYFQLQVLQQVVHIYNLFKEELKELIYNMQIQVII